MGWVQAEIGWQRDGNGAPLFSLSFRGVMVVVQASASPNMKGYPQSRGLECLWASSISLIPGHISYRLQEGDQSFEFKPRALSSLSHGGKTSR